MIHVENLLPYQFYSKVQHGRPKNQIHAFTDSSEF